MAMIPGGRPREFCTLFDDRYLSRGLALYASLIRHVPSFHLHALAMSASAASVLQALDLEFLSVIRLEEFETPELLAVKPSRSAGEYCWTCTPALIEHCLSRRNVEQCTYLDADLFFFSDPEALFAEIGHAPTALTPHGYAPRHAHFAVTSGTFCVQFMPFARDDASLSILRWWRDRCLEWCFARSEEGRFGDQKYLDDWPDRFPGVHMLRHRGAGVAPWNLETLTVFERGGAPWVRASAEVWPLVFYHFHNLELYDDGSLRLTAPFYRLSPSARRLVYRPYLAALAEAGRMVAGVRPGLDPHGLRKPPDLDPWRRLRRRLWHYGNLCPPAPAGWA